MGKARDALVFNNKLMTRLRRFNSELFIALWLLAGLNSPGETLALATPLSVPEAALAKSPASPSEPLPEFRIPSGQYVVGVITTAFVVMCVLIHYEVLKLLTGCLSRLQQLHRTRVLVLILGLMLTHLLEIWLYAFGYFLIDGRADYGHIQGQMREGWLDYVYFSFVTYTTVGYGDLTPVGPIRFLAALEALTGWVCLGWSSSFTFLEMQRFWREPAK